MGLASDADARGAGSPSSPGAGAGVVPRSGMKGSQAPAPTAAEETALILASLSKGQFGPVAFAADDSDPDESKHSDMEDLSGDDDDEEDDDNEHGGRVHRVQQINFDGPVGSKLDFMDDAGFSHRFRNESNRVKSLVTKHISIDELRAHFDRPIIDVAKDFGICITLMKKICRRNGIKRWPHRQIRSLSKSIASMEAAMLSTHGGEREKYRDQIRSLKAKRESVIADPNKDNGVRPKTPTKEGGGLARAKLTPPPHQQQHQAFVPIKADSGAFYQQQPQQPPSSTSTASTSGGAPTHAKGGRWTSDEHAAFLEGIRLFGKDWRRVAQVVASRSAVQTRTHAQKYLLKFAGRFPFEAATVKAGDADMAEMAEHDEPPAAAAKTPMALILNSPDSVSSQASAGASPNQTLRLPAPREDVPMYSPMSTASAMGRALPSLVMPRAQRMAGDVAKDSAMDEDDEAVGVPP